MKFDRRKSISLYYLRWVSATQNRWPAPGAAVRMSGLILCNFEGGGTRYSQQLCLTLGSN